jgi:hypothetical protein
VCHHASLTVKNILKCNGHDIEPKRGQGTGDEFLKLHGRKTWQYDFFSNKTDLKPRLRDIFVFVLLNFKTIQVYLTASTYKPDQACMIK